MVTLTDELHDAISRAAAPLAPTARQAFVAHVPPRCRTCRRSGPVICTGSSPMHSARTRVRAATTPLMWIAAQWFKGLPRQFTEFAH